MTNVYMLKLPSEISIPNLPNRWRQNMNSVWTDHYQRPLLTVCLYPRGAEGWEKLQQRPLITNLPLCVTFGTKLIGIRIKQHFSVANLDVWDQLKWPFLDSHNLLTSWGQHFSKKLKKLLVKIHKKSSKPIFHNL